MKNKSILAVIGLCMLCGCSSPKEIKNTSDPKPVLKKPVEEVKKPVKEEEYHKLLENMADYGFILRYPDDKKDITLIEPESWHLRYVGKDVAKDIYKKKITFEQYIADKYLEELYKDFPDELARG